MTKNSGPTTIVDLHSPEQRPHVLKAKAELSFEKVPYLKVIFK